MIKRLKHTKLSKPMGDFIMKKTIVTSLVALAALGFSGTSFAGNGGSYNGGTVPDGNDISSMIMNTAMSYQDNDTFTPDFSTDITTDIKTDIKNEIKTDITVGDIVAAVATASAPAYAAMGDLAVANASAYQESSFPTLEWVVTPVVGASAALLNGQPGTDGLVVGNITVSGAVGNGVGAQIGGAVFESINSATAIAINGTLGN
jgi:hypothetical protein